MPAAAIAVRGVQHALRLPALTRTLAHTSAPPVTGRFATYTTRMASTVPALDTNVCRVALCQILSGSDKKANLHTATTAIAEASRNRAHIVALPECFNSPYATDHFPVYAEPIPATKAEIDPSMHESVHALSRAAADNGVFLVGGSIPERDPADGKVYNTCVVFDPTGEIVAKHRKMHLFDIDVPGRITFKESDTLAAGTTMTTFDTPFGKCGVGICYDIRFPLYAMLLRQAGCKMLFYPGAFNMTTGPAHWELLQRARAVDTQSYVCTVSPARNPDSKYQAWGHSTVVTPWGEVRATTDETPGIVYADLHMSRVDEVRAQIPVGIQARTDLYSLAWAAEKK